MSGFDLDIQPQTCELASTLNFWKSKPLNVYFVVIYRTPELVPGLQA